MLKVMWILDTISLQTKLHLDNEKARHGGSTDGLDRGFTSEEITG